MSSDQAAKLRNLVAQKTTSISTRQCPLTVCSGSKGGVGTTTLSFNLAIAMQRRGQRVLLVEANATSGDLSQLCRLSEEYDLIDVLQSRCSIRQALLPGPCGVKLLPQRALPETISDASYWHLLRILDEIRCEFDEVIVDSGNSGTATETLWSAATRAVVVTTPEQLAVTKAYTLVKAMARKKSKPAWLGFVINRYRSKPRALDVQQRLMSTCTNYLQWQPQAVECVAEDDAWEVAVSEARSVGCANPHACSATSIEKVAAQLASGASYKSDLNPAIAG